MNIVPLLLLANGKWAIVNTKYCVNNSKLLLQLKISCSSNSWPLLSIFIAVHNGHSRKVMIYFDFLLTDRLTD